jgi:integrase
MTARRATSTGPGVPAPAAKRARARKVGSVYRRRSDGRWVATLKVRDPYTGVEKPVVRYCASEPEAERELARMIVERDEGRALSGDGGALVVFLQKWLLEVKKPALRYGTYLHYEGVVRLHILPYFRGFSVRDVTPQHIHDWLRALTRKGISTNTAYVARGVLLRAYKHALSLDMVLRNPVAAVGAPRPVQREMRVWTPAQARAFLRAVEGTPRHPLYSVALYMGLRLGEILGLRWDDLDLERGVVSVRAQLASQGPDTGKRVALKTAAATRRLDVPASLVGILRAHRRAQLSDIQARAEAGMPFRDSGYVFQTRNGTPVLHLNAQRAFARAVGRAGLPVIRFHDLRHTFASLAFSQGIPVPVISKMLGHSSVVVTLQVYTHIFDEAVESAAARMDELFGAGGS